MTRLTTRRERSRFRFAIALACVFTTGITGCSAPDEESPQESPGRSKGKPVAYAANYPLEYFAARIGAGLVDVVFPAPPDVDPAFWMPDVETILAFQSADVILLNGAGYSRWTDHASLPPGRLVDTSAGFRDAYLESTGTGTHSHGPTGDHSHTGTAFTTWLDLQQAAVQARAVRDALIDVIPEERDALTRNCDLLVQDLLALDKTLREICTSLAGIPLIASHPVYDYLSRRYVLDVESVVWEPDEFPSEAMWRDLGQVRSRHAARWMIWESVPLEESVARLQEIGVASVVLDPCSNRPETGDFMTVMRGNVERMQDVRAGAGAGHEGFLE